MAYFRKLEESLSRVNSLLHRDENWLILINADPDALGSAMALARLIRDKVKSVRIAAVNEVTRPDNLAMIRYLRIPVEMWQPEMATLFQAFALVDSQPHHHPVFENINFSIIIDHHPFGEKVNQAAFTDIRPISGATCTILTEYLYNAHIRPGKRLAVALQYGIRTDTNTFGRHSTEVDLRAYHFLSRFGDQQLLIRILRSEYLPEWLPCFSSAIEGLRRCSSGYFTFLGTVQSPDILVVVADFFTRVHGLRWVVVVGLYRETLVCIFRGDGITDLGKLASTAFGDIGSAGGHRAMARAEVPMAHLGFMKSMPYEDISAVAYNKLKFAARQHRELPELTHEAKHHTASAENRGLENAAPSPKLY